jgi:protein SCO1/2
MSSLLRLRWLIAVAAVAALVGLWFGLHGAGRGFGPASNIQSGTLLPQPRAVPDFTLQGADGKPYTRADLRGHWTLIFPGYTYCPDVCPTTLAELKAVYGKLGGDADKLQILFLSVDPERDTPQRLASYVHTFDPRFRAATGPVPALEKLGGELGFVFNKVPGKTPDSYLMDHSASMMLIDPQAQLAGYVVPPFTVEGLTSDLKSLIG